MVFVFACESGKAGKLRLFDQDFDIPKDKILKPKGK